MSHPNPVVIPGSGVPEVEQDGFEDEVARHVDRLEAERGTETEPVQDWYFTFGCGNTHRVTGEDLMGSYVVINGTYQDARERMVSAFGTAWCDQYGSATGAGVVAFKLRRIEMPSVAAEEDDEGIERLASALRSFGDRIAQAIGDPGSIVGRKLGPSWGVGNDGYSEREETVIRWGARAVLHVLTESSIPVTPAEERTRVSNASEFKPGDIVTVTVEGAVVTHVDSNVLHYTTLAGGKTVDHQIHLGPGWPGHTVRPGGAS